jgi:hypothetical protein
LYHSENTYYHKLPQPFLRLASASLDLLAQILGSPYARFHIGWSQGQKHGQIDDSKDRKAAETQSPGNTEKGNTETQIHKRKNTNLPYGFAQ